MKTQLCIHHEKCKGLLDYGLLDIAIHCFRISQPFPQSSICTSCMVRHIHSLDGGISYAFIPKTRHLNV